MSRFDAVRARIAPARQRLLAHPLYARMDSLEDVQRFMASHAFAVWDFMSLLKRLQRIPPLPTSAAAVSAAAVADGGAGVSDR